MKSISRAAFALCQSSISVGSQSQCRAIYNLMPMSVSGSVTISFTAWNSMIARFAKGFGTILMIVPARVIEEPRRILRAYRPASRSMPRSASRSRLSSGTGVAVPRSGGPRLPQGPTMARCPHFGHLPSRILWVSRCEKSAFVLVSETIQT